MVDVGDTVEFKVTGKVTGVAATTDNYIGVTFGEGFDERYMCFSPVNSPHISDFRVVPPPVETFKPGDLVREKGFESPFVYLITDTGYRRVGQSHIDGRAYPEHESDQKFTSDFYEKVEL